MRNKFLWIGVATFLSNSLVFAQLNESDTIQYQLRSNLTSNYQQGNVKVLMVRGKLDFSKRISDAFVFKTQNSSLYQAFSNTKADNDIFSRNYLYYKPENTIYPFAIGYISTNFRRKIHNRYFGGIGTTYQLINHQKNVLKLSVSVVYEHTFFRTQIYNIDNYNGSRKINLWRGTMYIAGWNYLFNKKIRIYYDTFYQPSFTLLDNYRIQLDIGADFPMWGGFSFNTLYTFSHENVVPLGIIPNDSILTFGFSHYLRNK